MQFWSDSIIFSAYILEAVQCTYMFLTCNTKVHEHIFYSLNSTHIVKRDSVKNKLKLPTSLRQVQSPGPDKPGNVINKPSLSQLTTPRGSILHILQTIVLLSQTVIYTAISPKLKHIMA